MANSFRSPSFVLVQICFYFFNHTQKRGLCRMSFWLQGMKDHSRWELRREIAFHQHARMSWDQLFQELMSQCPKNDNDDDVDDSIFNVYVLQDNVHLEENLGTEFESRGKMICELARNQFDFFHKLMDGNCTIVIAQIRSNFI